MDLIIDNIIYRLQKHGGITRIFSEALPRMCDLEPDLRISSLIYPNTRLDNLPKHERIDYKQIPDVDQFVRPYRLWHSYYPHLERFAGRIIVGTSGQKIWLSTYY